MKTHRLFLVSFLIVVISTLTGWRSHHRKHRVDTPITATSEPKMLDLSLPLHVKYKSDFRITQAKLVMPETNNFFEKSTYSHRALELKPQAIMSIEPEEGKIKSFDGAGIFINLKR